jgi:hypothetical protein
VVEEHPVESRLQLRLGALVHYLLVDDLAAVDRPSVDYLPQVDHLVEDLAAVDSFLLIRLLYWMKRYK